MPILKGRIGLSNFIIVVDNLINNFLIITTSFLHSSLALGLLFRDCQQALSLIALIRQLILAYEVGLEEGDRIVGLSLGTQQFPYFVDVEIEALEYSDLALLLRDDVEVELDQIPAEIYVFWGHRKGF